MRRSSVLVVGLVLVTVLVACRPADRYARRIPVGMAPGHHVEVRTFGGLERRGQPEGPKPIALTFDDGPGPNTAAILDILEREKVPATFFVVGRQIPGNEHLINRILAGGSRVANHTMNHADLHKVSIDTARQEIVRTTELLAPLVGPSDPVRCFRPPYGNTTTTSRNLVADLHLAEVQWSIDPEDWRNPGPEKVRNRVLDRAFPGAIVLLHDGGSHAGTVAALPSIIFWLRAAGYSFVSLC